MSTGTILRFPMKPVFICTGDDMHPYECNMDECVHCTRRSTRWHRVKSCAFCVDDKARERKREVGKPRTPPV